MCAVQPTYHQVTLILVHTWKASLITNGLEEAGKILSNPIPH